VGIPIHSAPVEALVPAKALEAVNNPMKRSDFILI
jgi:hypothetical protein